MLYLVSLPIGNLEDITLRARRVLKEAGLVLAEDTRKTGLLLQRLEIGKKKLLSFYEQNESQRIPYVIKLLKKGVSVALVSSAGTPLISDPGFKLVRKCREEGIEVTSCPGPSAVINALVLSGLPPERFLFLGFLPRRKKRQRVIREAINLPYTLIVFESPHRLRKTLKDFISLAGERRNCAVVREMTKLHEQVLRGSLSEVVESLGSISLKGEVVILLEGLRRA